jgi:hypothetical protein
VCEDVVEVGDAGGRADLEGEGPSMVGGLGRCLVGWYAGGFCSVYDA